MLAISKGRVCVVEHTVNDMTLYSVVLKLTTSCIILCTVTAMISECKLTSKTAEFGFHFNYVQLTTSCTIVNFNYMY